MKDQIQIQLPKLGESILGATVVQWLKQIGDRVELDEALLEVSTDKVNSEIPSPVAGILKEIYVQENDEVEIGAPLALIEVAEKISLDQPQLSVEKVSEKNAQNASDLSHFFSPAVFQMAMQAGISIEDLQSIPGSGEGGRITKKDVELFISQQAHSAAEDVPLISSSATSSKIKICGLRKAIADNMTRSYREVPHAAIVNEIDVTDLLKFISQRKVQFQQEHGVNLTITSFIAKAIANAVAKFPLVNASVDQDTIIVKHAVNVGVAVGVEQGVIVPVIKQCELKDITAIAKSIADLSSRTRAGQLTPDEVRDGTITMTNFGMAGARMGFPIIRFPEVAIIGIGAIQKRLMVIEEDAIAIRQMVDMTFCFDHRVIDGLYGCAFLNAMKEELKVSELKLF